MSARAVFDCMIFQQAAARPSRTHPLFDAIRSGRATLCISPEIVIEIEDVLCRNELRAKFRSLTPGGVRTFLAEILSLGEMHTQVPGVFSLARDPKDEKYVNLAVASRARFLVTHDRDLLDLMKAETLTGREFLGRYPDLEVLTPEAFLESLAGPEAG